MIFSFCEVEYTNIFFVFNSETLTKRKSASVMDLSTDGRIKKKRNVPVFSLARERFEKVRRKMGV